MKVSIYLNRRVFVMVQADLSPSLAHMFPRCGTYIYILTHLCLMDLLSLLYFTEAPVFNANSIEADQRSRSAASDLGLHCLPMSLLWDTRNKWVKNIQFCGFYLYKKITL